MKAATAVIFILAILLVPGMPAAADEGEKPEAGEKAKPKPAAPLQRLIKDLQALVAREKAKPEFDKVLVGDLQKLIKAFQKMEAPKVALADLSDEDRERLKAEVREEMAAERRAGGGGEGGDWASRQRARSVERALEGVDLKEDQRAKVEEMLGEFTTDVYTAYGNGDHGLVNDLKKDLEKRLRRVVGSKKARDIINNVNRGLSWGRRGGR